MGISGLQTYMEYNGICLPVDFLDLAKTTKRSRTIIVDLKSCLAFMTCGHFMWGGGSLKVYLEWLERFIRKFSDAGITLVFVMDGHTPEAKGDTRLWRAKDWQNKLNGTYDALSKQQMPTNPFTTDYHDNTERLLLLYFGCEVITAWDFEADEEVVRLAKERNAMAILAQDSDFAIFDTDDIPYLSAKEFDLNNMTTVSYDRGALARSLGLHVNQLPVFAILKGNDMFTYEMMKEFHKHLLRGQPIKKDLIRAIFESGKIPEFMRRHDVPSDYDDIMKCLPRLMQSVFGDTQHLKMARESIRSYFLKTEMPQQADHNTWNRSVIAMKSLSRLAYHVMKFNKLEINSPAHDSRDMGLLPPTKELFKNLRRRMYGVILYDKPGAVSTNMFTVNIEEASLNYASGNMETNEVNPYVPPAGSHPGLDHLWDDNYPNVTNLRQRLFFHILAPSVDIAQVKSMPDYDELLFPIVVLSSLLHDHEWPLLEDWELDVFIAQGHRTHRHTIKL